MDDKRKEIEEGLCQFIGTDQWHEHPFGLLYTDGIKWLADNAGAGCYWLIDLVASHQPKIRRRLAQAGERDFQVWRLRHLPSGSWIVDVWTDTPGKSLKLASQKIPCSDFPLDTFEWFVAEGIMLLKSEN